MTLIRFARMCEALELQDSTKNKIKIIDESLSSFSNPKIVIDILSLNLEVNSIGNKRAITWIANALELFDEEVKAEEEIWGDIGEGMYQFLPNGKESNYTIKQLYSLLTLDCSSINSDSYTIFAESINNMSNLELKWFIRYWLRTPRNNISNSTVVKAVKRRFPNKKVDYLSTIQSISTVFHYLENDIEPPTSIQTGMFLKPALAKTYNNNLPKKYILDIKYDGNRYQIHKNKSEVIIFNRKGKVVSNQFPDVVEQVKKFNANTCILDTEIYPVIKIGSIEPAPHKKMAARVHAKDKQEAMLKCPVKMVIFDVIQYMGELLIDQPYALRLSHLRDFPIENRVWNFAEEVSIEAAYNTAINRGYEGIMIKDLDAKYRSGRSNNILKHKPARIELDLVISSAKYGEGRRAGLFGSFGISAKTENGYQSVGNVGSGLSDGDLLYLTTELKKIIDKYSSDVFYVLPRIVLEVRCDLISQDSDGNYGLRFPRVVRIRNDKHPYNCNTMDDIKNMI
tara:strand:- start:219 stop:1748 length:1530 start_codon:yes stop_codon:yes gene_type:complete